MALMQVCTRWHGHHAPVHLYKVRGGLGGHVDATNEVHKPPGHVRRYFFGDLTTPAMLKSRTSRT